MGKSVTTTYIQVNAPKWVKPWHFKIATPIMLKVMESIRHSDKAMQGYIHAANQDGFPVKAGFATGQQLQELCMRAFWWSFEQLMAGKTLPHERGPQTQKGVEPK